ncbi:MAG: tetratricopeptide repeat protein [Bacteroidales bacterium]|nr:tetratricopeptide repeat protein [Bacteroidales bacterium]
METLKFVTKKLVLFFSLLLFFSFSEAQSTEDQDLQAAFEKSYEYESNGEYSSAIDVMRNVYDEGSYEVNLRLGWLTYMAGFFTESTAYYMKAINLKPMSLEARFGYVYPASALGNWEQVKNQYTEVLKIDPQNTVANYRMGSIYYGNEDYTVALKYFEKVVNLYPFDYDALIMYAWTNLKLGKFRESTVLFNKVLLNNPNDESALEGLSMIQ